MGKQKLPETNLMKHALTASLLVLGLLSVGTAYAAPKGKAEPAAGAVWTEPKTGMEFAWMPAGCFEMGGDGEKFEQPIHKVCVKGFWIGRTEVTQAQYQEVMGKNPSEHRGGNLPVENVSWDEASDFAEEMRVITGIKVKLPTEAQWEYACRAGGAHEKYCGAGGRPERLAWYEENSGKEMHAVAQLTANEWGLYDMSGNAWEWTLDCWNKNYEGAPADGSSWKSGECDKRVLRSGTTFQDAKSVRAADRMNGGTDYKSEHTGMRLVRVMP